jgi:WhiB family redox-sensing transcriptional regulator
VRSLRMAASWQLDLPEDSSDPDSGSWRYLARCADYDPDLFFPVGSSGPALKQALRAKSVCAQCPVRVECLDWAQATHQPHGVWGGLDEEERARLRGADSPYPGSYSDGADGADEILPIARSA